MDLTRRDFIKGLGALVGATIASQFDRQLETMARVLSGPQEWVLTFDERGLEQLAHGVRLGRVVAIDGQRATAEMLIDFSESDLWALATLTDPDGGEWTSGDGENWTCGDRKMTL